jgi:1,4-dihydroxy-2-naphthoate polyprenyltransferase
MQQPPPRLTLAAFAGLSRAPFLLLSPLCIGLGWTSAYLSDASVAPGTLLLLFIAALSAHIAVNALNEYDDFQSGLDLMTQRTPFSGGSGTLPADPALTIWAWRIGISSLVLTILLGLWLILQTPSARIELLILGGVGCGIIFTYTRWINRQPWLCLIAPGLGFGVLMVAGTHLVLRGQMHTIALAIAVIPFALINNLLLLNQLPDITADRNSGRRTLPVVYGEAFTLRVYLCQGAAVFVWIILGYWLDLWPAGALAALLTAPVLGFVAKGIQANRPQRWRVLGLNVALVLLTPLLFITGILLS